MPDRSMLVLYPASVAVSSVVSSCFIYELVKSTKLAFSMNTLLSVPSGNPRSETPHSLEIPVQRTPPCLRNSEKLSVGGYGYFLESPNIRFNSYQSLVTILVTCTFDTVTCSDNISTTFLGRKTDM